MPLKLVPWQKRGRLWERISIRRPISTTLPPPSFISPGSCSSAHGTRSRHHDDGERQPGAPAHSRAPAPGGLFEGGIGIDRLAHRLRARSVRRMHGAGTQLDKGYIGRSVPRPNAQRLLQGRGSFIDDLRFPRLAHVAFFRSPYAHARIKRLDFSKASKAEGVIGVFDGRSVAEYCTPWIAVLAHLKGIKSPPQHAITIERACWQGEAV